MKIKTKKTMNLPQLIEWAWDNGVRNVTFRGLDKKGYVVSISINDKGEFTSDWRVSKNDLFTVEVEEEITEDTHLDYLYVLTDAKDVHRCNNFTIKTASMVIGRDDLTFFTLIDNDLVKICDRGKLVE
ncbi:hypothetical protein [Staphylococcus sp. GDY8P131P]|uniref:hypothetical protein n=1 Tax=Staphylococcus sp. GDY8P131P TaxID=2804159 RepID=UPI001AEC6B1F|nr:hypothetical protein [Staphylococcus sp. GDY8P131P]